MYLQTNHVCKWPIQPTLRKFFFETCICRPTTSANGQFSQHLENFSFKHVFADQPRLQMAQNVQCLTNEVCNALKDKIVEFTSSSSLRNTSFADQTTKTSISHSILRIKT
jgi:hypothetical protein